MIGNVDADTDTFRAMLTTNSYTESKNHSKRSDITNEITATNYTAGGVVVTLTVSAINTSTNAFTITVNGATWNNLTGTARRLVVYKSRGGASSADELVLCIDFGSDVTRTNQTLDVSPVGTITIQN